MITSAGIELSDVGRPSGITWRSFASLISNLGYDSALWRSTHTDMAEWTSVVKTNIILADIYDMLAIINSNICGGFSHQKAQAPKPYLRPWSKEKTRKLGKGALPKAELREWIKNYGKRRSRNG